MKFLSFFKKKSRISSVKTIERSYNDGEDLTEEEEDIFLKGKCPDCEQESLYEGPSGGVCLNIYCSNCLSKFNAMGVFGTLRISKSSLHPDNVVTFIRKKKSINIDDCNYISDPYEKITCYDSQHNEINCSSPDVSIIDTLTNSHIKDCMNEGHVIEQLTDDDGSIIMKCDYCKIYWHKPF